MEILANLMTSKKLIINSSLSTYFMVVQEDLDVLSKESHIHVEISNIKQDISHIMQKLSEHFSENSIKSSNQIEQMNEIITKSKENSDVNKSSFSYISKKIFHLLEKNVRYNNHNRNFKTHIEHNTSPSSLHPIKYPIPFLLDDENFVNKYNEICEKTSKEIIFLGIKFL